MTIADTIAHRGINEVLHFTTTRGIVGMLYQREVLSRTRLKAEERLEFILKLNAPVVRDPGWEDYVNLSISEINTRYFEFSQGWHPGVRWVIAAFDPEILGHNHVYFTTTNNIYPSSSRDIGASGLQAMFADSVIGRYGQVHRRPVGMPTNLTTNEEAEVLYPERLSTKHLRSIYVPDPELEDQVHANIRLVAHSEVNVVVEPTRFVRSGWR